MLLKLYHPNVVNVIEDSFDTILKHPWIILSHYPWVPCLQSGRRESVDSRLFVLVSFV